MKKEGTTISIEQQFSYLASILNNEKSNLNLKVKLGKYDIDSKLTENMYLKLGYILMLLYVLNIDFSGDIKYNSGVFYIYSIKKKIANFISSKVESIIEDIINKSVYYKNFIPQNCEDCVIKHIKKIEMGFELAYKFFVDKKLELMYDFHLNDNIEFIDMLKRLNYNDLKMQLKFLNVKFGGLNKNNTLLEKLRESDNWDNHFVSNSCKFLDSFIEKSIIGMDHHRFEMMWIQQEEGKIIPTSTNNIYIAIYLKFLSKIQNNNYYLESAKQAINPLLKNIDVNEDDMSIELFKILYLNSNFIDYDVVDEYVRKNEKFVKLISCEDREELTIDTEKKAIQFIKNKTFNVLDNVII